MANKDLIKINVQNSYGDTRSSEFTNPNCGDIVHEVVTSLMLLGFSPAAIYLALEEQSEILKTKILN